ncbi:MAG: 3-hydroxyacyl-CoA dehydrogenase NAD-binding domain-containing protein [Bacillota bacterium]|nr:3-hydroxyacyl-CoA dehydrogenase NAD-binding domain-containing protein [Bacillota bacterium]
MGKTYKIGIVGAGNMGSGIAQKLAQEKLQITLVDTKTEFIERGLNNIRQTLQEGVERKIFTPEQVEEIMNRINGTIDLQELKDADLVIEAIFEDEKVKGELFAKLDEICEPKTIFATNTSSFYVGNLAKWTRRQDRFIGTHFFFHPAKNRLVEIIPHDGTSEETREKVLQITSMHGKTPILVKDSPGFCVNRIFIPWYVEAIRIIEEGIANVPTVNEGTKRAFGIGIGLFELWNMSGGTVIGLHGAKNLGRELGNFYAPPELLRHQVEDLNADFSLEGEIDESKMDIIAERLYAVAIGVACAQVDEGVVTIEDVDRAIKIGLAWRQGPFELINSLGIEKAYQLVKELSNRHPDFKMPELLIKQKEKGTPFEFKYVDLEITGDLAYITINRPEAMNALNPVVMEQLEKNFDQAEKNNSVKAIVIRGAGKAFIAGADIKFFVDNIKSKTVDKTYAFTRKGHDILLKLENSPKMTIALLDGLSLGGGSEVALACQAIVATPNGSLGFPEAAIGIFPGLGGMFRLERHLGLELAKYYIFTGKLINAADAHALGIVTKLVEKADIENAIRDIIANGKFDKYRPREIPEKFKAAKILGGSDNISRLLKGEMPQGVDPALAEKTLSIVSTKAPIALQMANELMDAQSGVSTEEAIELELARLYDIFATDDALAGLQSPPGRPPKYSGK